MVDSLIIHRHGIDRFAVVDFDATVGQTLDKQSAVRLRQNPGIENDDASGILTMSNQPTEALLQLDHRFRDLIFLKRVATAFPDFFESCFQKWMIRHTEGKPGDNDILKCVPRNVHTLPETIRPEKYGSRIVSKAVQHG